MRAEGGIGMEYCGVINRHRPAGAMPVLRLRVENREIRQAIRRRAVPARPAAAHVSARENQNRRRNEITRGDRLFLRPIDGKLLIATAYRGIEVAW